MSEKKELYNLIKNVATQHSYDDYTRNMLLATVPSMIEYYGKEYQEHIMNVISNVKISFVEEPEEMLAEIKNIEQPNVESDMGGENVTEADIRRSSGLYTSQPVLNYNEGKFTIDDVKRVLIVKKHDVEGTRLTMSTFVHELSHAIKAFKDEYTIYEDEAGKQLLMRRSGTICEKQELQYKDHKIVRNNGKKTGVGIEEGTNTIDEENIMNMIIGRRIEIDSDVELTNQVNDLMQACGEEKYKSEGYVLGKDMMQQLINVLKEYNPKQDAIEGKNTLRDAFENKLDTGAYQKFSSSMDDIVANLYQRMRTSPFEYDLSTFEIKGYTDKYLENLASFHRTLMKVNWFRDTLCGVKYEKNLSPAIIQALYSRIVTKQKIHDGRTLYKINGLDQNCETYLDLQMLEKYFVNGDGTFNFEKMIDYGNPYTSTKWQDLEPNLEETTLPNGKKRNIICSTAESIGQGTQPYEVE